MLECSSKLHSPGNEESEFDPLEEPTNFHFHDFVRVEAEQVESFADTNVLSNVAGPLPQEHEEEEVQESMNLNINALSNIPYGEPYLM